MCAHARTHMCRMKASRVAADGVRFAARLVDMPPEEMDVDAFVKEATAVKDSHGVRRVCVCV